MAVMYSVHADTEAEAEAELRRLCTALGVHPAGKPMQLPGRNRWMARAMAVSEQRSPRAAHH